jgi:hypothetical protein
MTSPEGKAHEKLAFSVVLSAACTPSCGHVAAAAVDTSAAPPLPTIGTAAPPATSCGVAEHAIALPVSIAGRVRPMPLSEDAGTATTEVLGAGA